MSIHKTLSKTYRYFVHNESYCCWRSLENDANDEVEELSYEQYLELLKNKEYKDSSNDQISCIEIRTVIRITCCSIDCPNRLIYTNEDLIEQIIPITAQLEGGNSKDIIKSFEKEGWYIFKVLPKVFSCLCPECAILKGKRN